MDGRKGGEGGIAVSNVRIEGAPSNVPAAEIEPASPPKFLLYTNVSSREALMEARYPFDHASCISMLANAMKACWKLPQPICSVCKQCIDYFAMYLQCPGALVV